MKTKFIINPISGVGKQKNITTLIEKFLDKNKFIYDIIFTKYNGHAKLIAKKAIKENYDILIAVGGDGTVNEISSELIYSNVILGIIPAGSGNGFAFHFRISKNIKQSILQLNNSKIETIDSGEINGFPFVNVSGIGFDAHIAKLFSKSKKRGLIKYIKLIFKELSYQSKNYTIKYNKIERQVNAILISFANASQYGNNFKISPFANVNDEKIDFVIIKNMPRWKIPAFLFKLAIGKIHTSRFAEIIKSNRMHIISDDNKELIHIDGEPVKINKEIKIKINPKSLKILIPNE